MKFLKGLLPNYLAETKKIEKDVKFGLFLEDTPIGELSYNDDTWHFCYTIMAANLPDFNPIPEFPELDKEYYSAELWPFFASRIPNIDQPKYSDMLANKKKESLTFAELLGLFGKQTIVNPFVLKEA